MEYLNTEINGESFKNKMKNIRVDYDENYSQNDLIAMGKLILSNSDYAGDEFRFLGWLFSKDIISNPGLNVPMIPDISILDQYDETRFSAEFLYSQKRKDLFEALKRWKTSFENYLGKDSMLTILIGGSFTDQGNDTPSDIDGIVLIPSDLWKANPIKFFLGYLLAISPTLKIPEFDFKLLPSDFNTSHFKGYNDLSLLSNNAEVRDKDGRMTNNVFTDRRVIRLTI